MSCDCVMISVWCKFVGELPTSLPADLQGVPSSNVYSLTCPARVIFLVRVSIPTLIYTVAYRVILNQQ
jgi:hypothetical protein